jgi:hypothetical protein
MNRRWETSWKVNINIYCRSGVEIRAQVRERETQGNGWVLPRTKPESETKRQMLSHWKKRKKAARGGGRRGNVFDVHMYSVPWERQQGRLPRGVTL